MCGCNKKSNLQAQQRLANMHRQHQQQQQINSQVQQPVDNHKEHSRPNVNSKLRSSASLKSRD